MGDLVQFIRPNNLTGELQSSDQLENEFFKIKNDDLTSNQALNSEINSASLYDATGESTLARFITRCTVAIAKLEECATFLEERNNFAADSAFMDAAKLCAELLEFRSINDFIALVVFEVLRHLRRDGVVLEYAELPMELAFVLKVISQRPFTSIEDAISLTEQIQEKYPAEEVAGFDELANLLLSLGDEQAG